MLTLAKTLLIVEIHFLHQYDKSVKTKSDHRSKFSLSSTTAVQIWIVSYKLHMIKASCYNLSHLCFAGFQVQRSRKWGKSIKEITKFSRGSHSNWSGTTNSEQVVPKHRRVRMAQWNVARIRRPSCQSSISFVVGSSLAPRVFLWVFWFSSLHKNRPTLPFPVPPG